MEITLTYIISQVFIIFNYIFLGITYQLKNRKYILIFNILSLTSVGIGYLLLNAKTGLAMAIVSIIRNIIFMYDEKIHGKSLKINKNDICILLFIYALCIILAILTYSGPLSLLSVAATMLFTYSVWQKNTKTYKWLGIPVCIIWLSYNIYIKSLFGIILELVLMISAVIGIIRENLEKGSTKKMNGISKDFKIIDNFVDEREFRNYIDYLFEKNNYKYVKIDDVRLSDKDKYNDNDIIIKKDELYYTVQIFLNRDITEKEINETLLDMEKENITQGIIITNHIVSNEMKEYANKKLIRIWDRLVLENKYN